MTIWEEFEIDCTKYLNDTFGNYATFIHQGGADSTVPDILVKTQSGKKFYIEAKLSPAQCGQFVLLPNLKNSIFEYSGQNANYINKYAEMIMQHMNLYFDEYREAGTSGKDIHLKNSPEIFSNWIIQTYQNKGVEFFITNNYTILPIERFKEYFDVTAKYRIKRSGSSNVGKNRLSSVMNYIQSHDYMISSSRVDRDKLFVVSTKKLHDQRFILKGIEYMFSLRGSEYELRKLSNTYNANVIFSIKHKPTIPGMSNEDFINALK